MSSFFDEASRAEEAEESGQKGETKRKKRRKKWVKRESRGECEGGRVQRVRGKEETIPGILLQATVRCSSSF